MRILCSANERAGDDDFPVFPPARRTFSARAADAPLRGETDFPHFPLVRYPPLQHFRRRDRGERGGLSAIPASALPLTRPTPNLCEYSIFCPHKSETHPKSL